MLSEREEVEGKIRECGKACHGNLAACWALNKDDKKAVAASSKGASVPRQSRRVKLTGSTRAGPGLHKSTP